MAEHLELLGTLTIPNGGTDSNVLSHRQMATARRLVIVGPATLTAAVTLYGSPLVGVLIAAMQPVRKVNDAADATIVAGKQTHVNDVNLGSIAVKSAGAEGAARAFIVYLVFEI